VSKAKEVLMNIFADKIRFHDKKIISSLIRGISDNTSEVKIRPEFFNIYSKNKIKNMKNLKYINLFENFIVNSYGREVESISQIINFSLTDKSKSDFETHTWIKKWETDNIMEYFYRLDDYLESEGFNMVKKSTIISKEERWSDKYSIYRHYNNSK
jgi:hypothetical protein